ncbi:hypothetical protein SeMB42_g01438 [Synchytrium endobioticum]|uniref:Uncharacterized protein n=1 Tax=Synchytrium endobioticum TaxID=286115 RepID=A0A507DNF3_9FUNG|nr:hypothetical protein SeMB42_g01438 [Synchytrium endobioticum]
MKFMVRNRNWANLEHSYLFILTPESSNIVDLDSKTEVVAAYLSPVNSRHEDRVAAQGTCPQGTVQRCFDPSHRNKN